MRAVGAVVVLLFAGACGGEGAAAPPPTPGGAAPEASDAQPRPQAPVGRLEVEPTVVTPGQALPATETPGRPHLETVVTCDGQDLRVTVRRDDRTAVDAPPDIAVRGWLIQGPASADRGTLDGAVAGGALVLRIPADDLPILAGEYWLMLEVEYGGDRYFAEPARFEIGTPGLWPCGPAG